MDSHSVFADPDPAVFLNADPDLALKLRNNLPYEEFAVIEPFLYRQLRFPSHISLYEMLEY